MARHAHTRTGGARWRRAAVCAMLACGTMLATGGCSQPVPESTPAAGEFFRRVGQLSMLKRAGAGAEANADGPSVAPEADDGAVPTVTDSNIRLDLGMRLEEGAVSAAEVEVSVDDQVVVLEGTVSAYTARDRVELIAREVQGVRAVDNRLEVDRESSSPVGRADGGRKKQK